MYLKLRRYIMYRTDSILECPYFQNFLPFILPKRYVIPMYEKIRLITMRSQPHYFEVVFVVRVVVVNIVAVVFIFVEVHIGFSYDQ